MTAIIVTTSDCHTIVMIFSENQLAALLLRKHPRSADNSLLFTSLATIHSLPKINILLFFKLLLTFVFVILRFDTERLGAMILQVSTLSGVAPGVSQGLSM